NNEWREGWLDEGFTSFQTGWFFETHGAGPAYDGLEPWILSLDLERWSEPVSLASEQYRDFSTYNAMIYSKAQLFYEELRYVVGDETMHRILRAYFARWRLKHVDEDALREVAEDVSGRDLQWLFGEWLHATPLFDYRLERVERHHLADGRWRTVVTIERRGHGRLPVEIGDGDTIYARATGQLVAALATGPGATNRFDFYGRWGNPIGHPEPRTETSVSAWSAEGRAGAKLSMDRSLRQHLDFGADPHVGFDAVWMATTELGY